MPKLTGFEVFELVKKKDLQESIAFYILTSNITDKDIERCECLKIDCFKKPFSLEHFSNLIKRLIMDSKKVG
jgi:DNA-binding response OmpR family regulator